MVTQKQFLDDQIKELDEVIKVRETGNDFSNWRLCGDEFVKGCRSALKNIRDIMDADGFEADVGIVLTGAVYMPSNEFGIPERYFNVNQLVKLLKDNKDRPEVVDFIAEMMEY